MRTFLLFLLVVFMVGLSPHAARAVMSDSATAVKVYAGKSNLYVVKNGILYGYGKDDYGQMGLGSTATSRDWTILADGVTGVSGGEASLIMKSGQLYGAGRNGYSSSYGSVLGNGLTTGNTLTWTSTLQNVKGVSNSACVAAASGCPTLAGPYARSLAITNDGNVYASGSNYNGALGVASPGNFSNWTQVFNDVKDVVVGGKSSLVLREDGTVWGSGEPTALGQGMYVINQWTQVFSDAKAVAAGYEHAAILKTDGTVWVTGKYDQKQLGEKSSSPSCNTTTCYVWLRSYKAGLAALSNVASIAAGQNNTYAIQSDGALWITGSATNGTFGDGTASGYKTWTNTLNNVRSVAGSGLYSIAVKNDNTVWVTGSEFGASWVQVLLPPGPVVNLTATQGTVTGGINLSWSADQDASAYEVSEGGTVLATVTSNSYQVSGLSGVEHHTYSVRPKVGALFGPGRSVEGWPNQPPTSATLSITTTSDAISAAVLPVVTDPNGETNFTVEILSQPSQGVVSIENGRFVYQPPPNNGFIGSTTSFSFRVIDQAGGFFNGTGTVTVNCAPPTLATPVQEGTLVEWARGNVSADWTMPACGLDPWVEMVVTREDGTATSLPREGLSGSSGTVGFQVKDLPRGSHSVAITVGHATSQISRNRGIQVVGSSLPAISLTAPNIIEQHESLVTLTAVEEAGSNCPMVWDEMDARSDSGRCQAMWTSIPAGLSVVTTNPAQLQGRPSQAGQASASLEIRKYDSLGNMHVVGGLTKNFDVRLNQLPVFGLSGDMEVTRVLEDVALVIQRTGGNECPLYLNQSQAVAAASPSAPTCWVDFPALPQGITPSMATDKVRVTGRTAVAAGDVSVQWRVRKIIDSDTMITVADQTQVMHVVNPALPEIQLVNGTLIGENRYFASSESVVRVITKNSSSGINSRMVLTVDAGEGDQPQVFRNLANDASRWLVIPGLSLLEERQVHLRLAYVDYPDLYSEKIIHVVGGLTARVRSVLEAPSVAPDSAPVEVTLRVGEQAGSAITYDAPTMGTWMGWIAAKESGDRLVRITDKLELTGGVGQFTIPTAGTTMKLVGIAELQSGDASIVEQRASAAKYVTVVKGTALQGNITANRYDGRAPLTTVLTLHMPSDSVRALDSIQWEKSTDQGLNWQPLEDQSNMRLVQTIPVGVSYYRARMTNRNSQLVSYTEPVAVMAYQELEVAITAPQHTLVGLPVTLTANVSGEESVVHEWRITLPGESETILQNATVTVNPNAAGQIRAVHRARPATALATSENGWTVTTHTITVASPVKLTATINGPDKVEVDNDNSFTGRITLPWGNRTSAAVVESEWLLPSGEVVPGPNLTWRPLSRDEVETAPLVFRAWVSGLEQQTLREVSKVVHAAPPLLVELRTTVSNRYTRVPFTYNVRGIVSGLAPRDRVASWRWFVDGQAAQAMENRSSAAFSITTPGEHVVRLDIVTVTGASTSNSVTVHAQPNRLPECTVNGARSGADVILNASCTDFDGRVTGYQWTINGTESNGGVRRSHRVGTTTGVLSVEVCGIDDSGGRGCAVVNVPY
ncbi:MAG: hypothetical protein G8345_14075 [Magnetococcales bacterium]|nr:hypothetical protein [Magnetococcales bacterium]NGZ28004.1 hypothetical protein [Magnetococcales bacterium]